MFWVWVVLEATFTSDNGKYIFYAVLIKVASYQVFKVVRAVEFFPQLQQASDGYLPTSHAWQFSCTSRLKGFQPQQNVVEKFLLTGSFTE